MKKISSTASELNCTKVFWTWGLAEEHIVQKKCNQIGNFDLEPRRVFFRCRECFHSNRNQFLLRSWCSIFFSTFRKNIFSVDLKKKVRNFRDPKKYFCENRQLSQNPFENYKNIFWIPKISAFFFQVDRKIFFRKVEKKIEYQDRRKISRRIECAHSQHSKA